MQKVLILKGLPASGKTTYAKELVAQGNWKRINKDDLRAMLDSSFHSKKNEKFINTVKLAIMSGALASGWNVVIDDTNFFQQHEESIRETVKEIIDFYKIPIEVIVKFFDTPLEECIARDAKRGAKMVGEKVIRGMHSRYLKKETVNIQNPAKVPFNDNLAGCYLFDIDGTLAHMNGKRGPFDWKRVGQDEPDYALIEILSSLEENTYNHIIILSGRDEVCRTETEEWLYRNGVTYDALYMRPENDNRKDTIVKEEIYRRHIEGKYNVRAIFDDRDCVVHMWRSLGLPCYQVAPGNF